MNSDSHHLREDSQVGSAWPVGVMAFTLGYLAAAVFGAVETRNAEFIFYIAVMILLIAALTAVHLRVRFSRPVLWGLSVWGLAHMAGGLLPVPATWPIHGEIRVLYSLWLIPGRLKYDQVVHAYGFAIATCVCWEGLRASIRGHTGVVPPPSAGLLLLSAAAANGFGALNEIVEFIATLLIPKTNVGDYVNTGWDLVANGVGTLVAAVVIGLMSGRKDPGRRAASAERPGLPRN